MTTPSGRPSTEIAAVGGRPGLGIWATIGFVPLMMVITALGVVALDDTLLVMTRGWQGIKTPPPVGLTTKWVTVGVLVALAIFLLVGARRRRRWLVDQD